MKKKIELLALYFLLSANILYSQKHYENYYDSEFMDANNIKVVFDNYGGLNFEKYGGGGAGFWDRLFEGYYINDWYVGEVIIYDQGLWVLGKSDTTQVLNYSWWGRTNYSPGPIINGSSAVQANPRDKDKYRIYKISDNDNSSVDILNWPFEFGAPIDNDKKPLLHADQTVWTVFNSCNTIKGKQYFFNEPITPVKLEIQQMAYAYEGGINSNILSDVIFLEWTIINKGTNKIDSTYIGLWSDLDLSGASHNPPAVDTLRQLGYCWSNIPESWSTYYRWRCPAVGYVMLYGPKIKSQGDTAIFKGRELTGYRNIPLSSFFGITDNNYPLANTPYFKKEVWNIARGFDLAGNIIIDSVSGKHTKFPFSGDPITNTGWNWNYWTNGEAGFYMFTGPFTFEPADTQWVMYAITAGLDTNKFGSITKLRRNVDILRSISYDDLVKITPLEYEEPQTTVPEYFYLSQNFPNPFNPTTKIRYEIPIQTHVNISVYDILGRKVAEIVNKEQEAGYYEVEIDGGNWASGVYFIRIETYTYSKTIKAVLMK
ncbi:MAG: T9SS type A sorting domain-containing protein [bacterium]